MKNFFKTIVALSLVLFFVFNTNVSLKSTSNEKNQTSLISVISKNKANAESSNGPCSMCTTAQEICWFTYPYGCVGKLKSYS